MNSLKLKISVLLGIIAVICLIAGLVLLTGQRIADKESEALVENMQAQAESREQETSSQQSSEDDISTGNVSDGDNPVGDISNGNVSDGDIPAKEKLVDNPYQDSFLANEDMAGWLKIEDTKIDYPVMWTPGDETYYLYKNFEGKKDQNGSLLLDTDSCLDPLTTNLIIHGHNMRDGDMFGTLTDYEDPDYCQKHNIISLYTENCERKYEVVAVFRSQVYRKTDQVFKFYKFFQADTQEEFDDFYENIKKLSLYDTGVSAEFGDRFITLSTCVYHVEQGRFVVVAKEIEPGDSYVPFREQAPNQELDNTN